MSYAEIISFWFDKTNQIRFHSFFRQRGQLYAQVALGTYAFGLNFISYKNTRIVQYEMGNQVYYFNSGPVDKNATKIQRQIAEILSKYPPEKVVCLNSAADFSKIKR